MKKTMVSTNRPIVSTNWLNKVIAAMMMMAITSAMPAMAGNKTTVSTSRQHNNGKNYKVVVVVDKKTTHFNAHKHVYRPDVKACTFRVSRYDSHMKAVAKAEHMKGVMNTKWNPRTRELTVIYDAKVTSARHIMHLVA